MTSMEGAKLYEMIANSGFDFIPTLNIRISLTANLAVRHKKETVNDQIDIMRLSTGMPVADLLFTDKQRKYELEQTGLAAMYSTEIFSGTNSDLERFCDRLERI